MELQPTIEGNQSEDMAQTVAGPSHNDTEMIEDIPAAVNVTNVPTDEQNELPGWKNRCCCRSKKSNASTSSSSTSSSSSSSSTSFSSKSDEIFGKKKKFKMMKKMAKKWGKKNKKLKFKMITGLRKHSKFDHHCKRKSNFPWKENFSNQHFCTGHQCKRHRHKHRHNKKIENYKLDALFGCHNIHRHCSCLNKTDTFVHHKPVRGCIHHSVYEWKKTCDNDAQLSTSNHSEINE